MAALLCILSLKVLTKIGLGSMGKIQSPRSAADCSCIDGGFASPARSIINDCPHPCSYAGKASLQETSASPLILYANCDNCLPVRKITQKIQVYSIQADICFFIQNGDGDIDITNAANIT